jgi:general secretion pathway protein L
MGQTASTALAAFLRWWTGELKSLLPNATMRGPANRRLVIAVDGSRRSLLLEKGGASTVLAEAGEADGGIAMLADLVHARPGMPIGLRLSPALCFTRRLELPARAEGDFAGILDLEMERTTPFRSTDVLTAFHVDTAADVPRGKRAVRHLVVKRKTIEPILAEMRGFGLEPAFADCWDEDRQRALPVDFLAVPHPRRRRGLRLHAMAALCLLLAAAAIAGQIVQHRNALQTLEIRTSEARAEAASVRQSLEASQAAAARMEAMQRRLRGRLPIARILEELTAILPDSAWVSDLRIEGDAVEFTGFAKSAAALIPLLEASPLFAEAALTSPVVLDNNEDKERFSARLRLSLPDRAAIAENATAREEEQ